ncbi:MAG: hypothetical protein R3B68_16465 [Phycisphaerales bacterium]
MNDAADTPSSVDAGNPLDGVRPRNAACEHCGYQFGGAITIEHGAIRCPECGLDTIFSFEPMARTRPARARLWRVTARGLTIFLVLLFLYLLYGAMFGSRNAPWWQPLSIAMAVGLTVAVFGLIVSLITWIRKRSGL